MSLYYTHHAILQEIFRPLELAEGWLDGLTMTFRIHTEEA
jgi:hypothetical protein